MSWPLVNLNDVAFFQEGPGIRNWQFRETGIKLVNVKNIVNGVLKLENSDKYLDEKEVQEKYSHFLVEEGDLLMASSGATWGKTAWVERRHLPICMNTSMIRFQSLDKNVLSIEYLAHYLNGPEFKKQMDRLITGSAQPNFGSTHLKQIKFPLPPLEEQKRIAAILDKADAIRRKRQQAIKLADDFLRSVFLEMFGDPVTNPKGIDVIPMTECFHITTGKLNSNSANDGGKYPFFTCAKEIFYIDDYAFDQEALLLAGNNASADYDVKHYVGKFNAYQRTYVLTLKDDASSYEFYKFALEYQLQNLKRSSKGSNTKYITMEIMAKTLLPSVDERLQDEFVRIYKRVGKIISSNMLALKKLEIGFESLSQKAFSGKL